MAVPDKATRLDELADVVSGSTTPLQLSSRQDILRRIMKYIDRAPSTADFEDTLMRDTAAWCAWHLNDYAMRPIFLTPWQIEACELEDRYNFVLGLTSRKVGKTLRLAARITKELATHHLLHNGEPFRMTIFAPSKSQDFVFRDITNFVQQGYELYDTLMSGGGKCVGERITTNVGAEVRKRTVGQQSEGYQIKGERDSVAIDEIQDVKKRILTKVILPIISDTYSIKRVWLWGTPDTRHNPDFERYYIEKLRDPTWGCAGPGSKLYVDWMRGVREGCTDRKIVEDIIRMMPADESDMEYRAKFPTRGARFYDRLSLESCKNPNLRWHGGAEPGANYGMAVDWAKYHDRTEILLGKKLGTTDERLQYVYHKRIDPAEGVVDYTEQVNIVKRIYHLFRPRFFIYDATSMQDTFTSMLFANPNPVNPSTVYQHKGHFGFKASGPENYDMHRHHRDLIMNRRIEVPAYEPFFTESWVRQHNELSRKPVQQGAFSYERFEAPADSFKDFAVTAAMLSKFIEERGAQRASCRVMGWGGREKRRSVIRRTDIDY